MKMRTNGKSRLKIIAACSVAIFSLLAVCGGVFAWFTTALSQSATVDEFAVINMGNCDLYSCELIKFDFKTTVYPSGDDEFVVIDYLTPETGKVNKYDYDSTRHQFGKMDGSTWVPVSAMNTYDPVDLLIFNRDLKDLNCNAIYKFTVSSPDLINVDFDAMIKKATGIIPGNHELLLSDCCDFDIYWDADLADDNPAFTPATPGEKPYCPSYIDEPEDISELEEIYYKISYLSSLESSHTNFYSGSDDEIALASGLRRTFTYDSTLDEKVVSFYVNVNYSVSQLDEYKTKIYSNNIRLIYDFGFRFYFFRVED